MLITPAHQYNVSCGHPAVLEFPGGFALSILHQYIAGEGPVPENNGSHPILLSHALIWFLLFSHHTGGFPVKFPLRIEALSPDVSRSEEHTSELQSRGHLVCRLLLEKKKNNTSNITK